ncbi:hypothetical protein SAMN02745866_04225 [Alteromonadaceae bacterium Bs31]|nr:hypothetical protein SAMN02745866_04225 [Alteromonadaceae bacterium Bs31]
MITIHCTKKLWSKLPLDAHGRLPSQDDTMSSPERGKIAPQLGDWHANLVTLQRRNCILLVHNATRFPVFISCLTKPGFASLQWQFEDVFMNTLLKLNANQRQLDAAAAAINSPLCFDSTTERSLLGALNNLKANIEHVLYLEELLVPNLYPPAVSASLAQRPCKANKQNAFVMPNEEMLSVLDKLAAAPKTAIQTHTENLAVAAGSTNASESNVVSFAAFKKGRSS